MPVRGDETNRLARRRYDSEAAFYDLFYSQTDDIAFYEALAKKVPGPILECACGTGRITIPLARAGHDVTGVDVSSQMLRQARAKVRRESPEVRRRIHLRIADMRSIRMSRKFALCLIPFFSFHHLLTEEDRMKTLLGVRRLLLPGGKLVFNVFNPDLSRPEGLQRLDKVIETPQQTAMRYSVQWFDRSKQITHGWLIYEFAGPEGTVRRQVTPFRLAYFLPAQMKKFLRRAGFRVASFFGGYDGSKFTPKSQMMIFVAVR